MGSEDSTDSSVSAQKGKGTKFGSLLKGAFGSMTKAVKGSKPEKKFFGREKVKDDYIESLECINGIHSNSDPELPDITKRNVMPGRFAKVEAPKIRTEIRPKTYEVMDEVSADDADDDESFEAFEEIESVAVPEVEPVVHVPAEPVIAEPVFVQDDEDVLAVVHETVTEEEEEGEVDYFDFLPPMKAVERAPARKVPQSRPVEEVLGECEDEVPEEAEIEEEEEEEEHVATREEVFIDIFDDVPCEAPVVSADFEEVPAETVHEEPVIAEEVMETVVSTEIDLDILDVPVISSVQIEEVETEVAEKYPNEAEALADIFDDVADAPAGDGIDLDILDVPVSHSFQEEEIECADEEPVVSEIHVPAEIPAVLEMQRAVPEAAVPAYGRLSIDFDAFDRAAESPLDARFDVEEVEHVHVPKEEVSFDIASLETVSIPTVSEEMVAEIAEVQVSPINVEIDFASLEAPVSPINVEIDISGLETPVSPINVEIDISGLETPVSPINVEIDFIGLETPVSPINVEIDISGLETPVSPINVEIDLSGLETPVSPFNVEIDMISLTAVKAVVDVSEDHSSYVPNFVLVNDEDVVEVKAESELSSMMPETVLRTFDSEHEFLEIDVLDVMDDIVTEAPAEVPEQEMRETAEILEGISAQEAQEPALSDLMTESILRSFDSEHEFLEIDVLDVAEESDDLEIDESEITDGPNFLEIDITDVKEFLEIDESEITDGPNYLEVDVSEIMEFLEIDESEVTEVSAEPNFLEIDVADVKEFLEIDESEITEVIEAVPVHDRMFAHREETEAKGGIFFSFFTKEDKEDNISISFGEAKEEDDVMDDSNESVTARDDYAVTVSSVDGNRKLFI
jgi:hypothetical protein